MSGFGKYVVKLRIPILILAVILLIPSLIGYLNTRTNYDILTYLPDDLETMKGQEILADDFGTGAFSNIVIEGLSDKEIEALADKIEEVDGVKKVIWYGSLFDLTIPEEMLPDKYVEKIKNGDSKLMMVVYSSTMSDDQTLEAVEQIREIADGTIKVGGFSAVILDTKNLSDGEVPIYVAIAVVLCLLVLTLTMDSFLIPVFFLLSIGCAIIYNMGTNFIQGEISYVTKALAAVLQLAVTMDYSIFLWHSYCAEKENFPGDNNSAMATAINKTLVSVVGSSITTVAGFVALCFMSFTLGLDLGVVMAKGVIFGVICCVTVLPSMILVFDKLIVKTTHKPIIPDFSGISGWIVKHFYIALIIFAVLIVPAYYGQAHNSVYYNLDSSLPDELESIQANAELTEKFGVTSTHMILLDSSLDQKTVKAMSSEMEDVDGVNAVIGLETLTGSAFPVDFIPDDIKEILDDGEYQLIFVLSDYTVASDEVNAQCDTLNEILDKYDENGMLIGEAPCTEDLITITNHDFNVVNSVSIILVGIIIIFVFKSISLPVLLVSVIEFAIFINMGIPYYAGTVLPFVASIVIGTIQLGSTVDYAILMTNKYKELRYAGVEKVEAVTEALRSSMTSIFVSALTFFAATFGVGMYSDIDMISSLCILMARGAIISMFVVLLLLPAVLRVFDGLIIHTSAGFRPKKSDDDRKHEADVSTAQ